MSLKGSVSGSSRDEILAKAKTAAADYYGTKCVLVGLSNEHPSEEVVGEFWADFEAREHHRLNVRTYGPAQCRGCKRESWPHDPLPQWVSS